MDFKKTKTYENLAKSYASECMTGMKHRFMAEMSKMQGYTDLYNELSLIAQNETKHAKVFFDYIVENGDDVIAFSGDFPFFGGTLEQRLFSSILIEKKESEDVYPAFLKTAQEEGFTEIAKSFEQIISVEKTHRKKFENLYDNFKNGTLYKSRQEKLYVCTQCGYSEYSKEAWHICPLCSANQGFVKLELPENANEK